MFGSSSDYRWKNIEGSDEGYGTKSECQVKEGILCVVDAREFFRENSIWGRRYSMRE